MSLLTFIVKNALRIHSPEISGTGEKVCTQKSSIERTKLPLFWAGISSRGQDYYFSIDKCLAFSIIGK